MLRIHKSTSKKLPIAIGASICGAGVLLGFSVLTYTPELSHAETMVYNPPIPQYHPNISDITYMQDMTEEVCQNSYENDTKQLIDKRDSKTYWVTKLKDGNCWMTQNLDLDLYVDGANRKLTSADSDMLNDWTSMAGVSSLWSNSDGDYNKIKYYDPGEYVYTKPTNQLNDSCGLLDGDTCKNAGWELMSGASINNSGNEMAHYLVGNYYTWGAATAGQAASFTGNEAAEATRSICPRGWRLPINSGDKSYANLFAAYGALSGLYAGTWDIRLTPFYFVYGGIVSGSSLYAGSSAQYWSSTADSASNAYYMYFTASVTPSDYNRRHFGFSVRCVARGEAVVRPEAPSVDNVMVNINPQISLDVADEVRVEKGGTNLSTANLDVKVTSNQKYSVGISATNPNLTSSTNSTTIPAKSGLLNTAENGWGIKLKDDTEFMALTSDLQTFYTASGAEIKTIPFTIGISTAPDLPNGEYSTDITVTATQN